MAQSIAEALGNPADLSQFLRQLLEGQGGKEEIAPASVNASLADQTLADRTLADRTLATQTLAAQILADQRRAHAFGTDLSSVADAVAERLDLLRTVYPILQLFCHSIGIPDSIWLATAWNLWLPLAFDLVAARQAIAQPFIQGILGGQGTGKTTLSAILTQILAHLGYRTLSWSLDDLYKTYADRQALQEQDPRFGWRGPPGTHEVALGIRVLDAIRAGQAVEVPRFDKSLWKGAGDRVASETVANLDIVLFEGWFVGARPIDPSLFETAPAPIVTDADRAFARDVNVKLRDYLPLWERLDRLLVLYPIDYRWSKQWRKQAEQQMQANGKPGMSEQEMDAFVNYFWQALHPELFITPLVTQPGGANLVVEIDAKHLPGAVYRSGDRPVA